MFEEKTPVGAALLPPSQVMDWVGPSGLLRVQGIDYHLPAMDVGELNELHQILATDADMIRHKLAQQEVERSLAGSLQYDALDWRNRARFALGLKKKQMSAIHSEFARRKTLIPPLAEFAFSAVHEIYGEVGLGRVLSRARTLQDQRRKDISRKGKPISRHPGDREVVCGDKVPYQSEERAAQCIEQMELAGANVAGLSVYGPCPWCDKWHVGHSPDYQRRKRQRERRREEKQAQAPT